MATVHRAEPLEPANATDYITLEVASELASAFFQTPNLRALDFHVGAFAAEKLGHLADHKLLTVRVRRDQSEESCSFFLKTLVPNCSDFERLVFKVERDFFADYLPKLLDAYTAEPWAPKCYLAKNNLLVLQDLRAQKFRSAAGEHKLLSLGQLKAAVEAVARFHACSMIVQAKSSNAGQLSSELAARFREKTFVKEDKMAWKWLATGIEVGESVARDLGLDPKYLAIAYDMAIERIKSGPSTPNSVICHKDLWMNNMMFSEDDQTCRLVDFQMLIYNSFAIDLLQLIHSNADRNTRQQSERELVRYYHSELIKTLVDHGLESDDIMTLDQVFQTIEEKRIIGLVMSVQFLPIALLNAQLAKEYSQDHELFVHYCYTSRKDFVNNAMQSDQDYRRRVQESVAELVEFMQRLQNK